MAGKTFNIVGTSPRKVDGLSKCSGATRFADDLAMPRMLFCKLLRADVPHARIRSIDTGGAEKAPGVVAALTGAAMPVPFGILPVSQDEHALCVERVRFVGDPVAAVAAVDEETAYEATKAIRVEYEPLAPVFTPEEAIENRTPPLHDYGDDGNVHKRVSMQFGDVEGALGEADVVLEDVVFYQGSTHLPME
ncbi:MAG: xanthine dehydrogenase family protein molybdopterin-binding subunit, partial [Planctomycetota bacterium]